MESGGFQQCYKRPFPLKQRSYSLTERSVSVELLFIMLSDAYNNNLNLSVAKTRPSCGRMRENNHEHTHTHTHTHAHTHTEREENREWTERNVQKDKTGKGDIKKTGKKLEEEQNARLDKDTLAYHILSQGWMPASLATDKLAQNAASCWNKHPLTNPHSHTKELVLLILILSFCFVNVDVIGDIAFLSVARLYAQAGEWNGVIQV